MHQVKRNLNPYTRNNWQSLDDLHSVNNISQHNVELIRSTAAAAAADDIDAEKDADDDGFLKKPIEKNRRRKRSSRMHWNGVEREKLPAYQNVSLTVSFSIMIQRYEWKLRHHHQLGHHESSRYSSQPKSKYRENTIKTTEIDKTNRMSPMHQNCSLPTSFSLQLPLTRMLSNCQRTHHQVMIFIRAILLRYVFYVWCGYQSTSDV